MSRRWLGTMLLFGTGWMAMASPAVHAQALPFAYRLRPKVLFRYGYRFGMDPYYQNYFDPYRKVCYQGEPYEYYGTDYAEKVLGRTRQQLEPSDPSVLPPNDPRQFQLIDARSEPAPDANKRAHLRIRVPAADAQVWFGGYATGQQGLERSFHSPVLEPGQDFTYDIRVRWKQDGSEREETRSIQVQSGQEFLVDFRTP